MKIDVVKDGVAEGGDEFKWEELTKILDMTASQFLADKRIQLVSSSDSEGEEVDEQAEDGLEEEEQQQDV